MTLEERHNQINNMINQMANDNSDITQAQIRLAKIVYADDNRPLADIAQELKQYSKDISQSVQEQLADPKKTSSTDAQTAINESFAEAEETYNARGEETLKKDFGEMPFITSPQIEELASTEVSASTMDELHGEMSSEFINHEIKHWALDSDAPKTASSFFTEEAEPFTDVSSFFTEDSSTFTEETDAKVFTKEFNAPPVQDLGSEDGGFTSTNSLLTITLLLSIMGLLISTLILYTK